MDSFYQFIANVIPPKLVYWAYIRLMAFASTHDEGATMGVDQISFGTATDIWRRYHKT